MRDRFCRLTAFVGCLLLIGGCGSDSASVKNVWVSDAYVIDANVTLGGYAFDLQKAPGQYVFESAPFATGMLRASGGVNDINENAVADAGESYAPAMMAPASYDHVNPFTTLSAEGIEIETLSAAYPNSYAVNPKFNFDVVRAGKQNLLIAKEAAQAALILAYAQSMPEAAAALYRVYNGTEVESNDTKWEPIVGLSPKNSDAIFCAGSLIDDEWVLTAAHCVYDRSASDFDVRVGSYSLDAGGTRVSAVSIHVHEGFNVYAENDIALVRLAQPVTGVAHFYLDRSSALAAGTPTRVAGWGSTRTSGIGLSDRLMEALVPIIDFDLCNSAFAYDNTLTEDMVCAGYMAGDADSCSGDSGGPLIYEDLLGWKLAGIVSFGGTQEQLCGAPNFPGVYTKVQNYVDWIEARTGELPQLPEGPLGEAIFQVEAQTSYAEVQTVLNGYLAEWLGSYGD